MRRRTRLSYGPAIPIEAKTAQKDLNRGHSRGSRAERRTGAEMRISRGAVSPASYTHTQTEGRRPGGAAPAAIVADTLHIQHLP